MVRPTALKIWLITTALLASTPLSAGEAGSPNPWVRTADGITAYLGIVPGELVRGQTRGDMHPGIPHHLISEQHVIVALFETASGARIRDARVSIFIVGVGRSASEHVLDGMEMAGAFTYGTFMPLPAPGPYRLRVEVRRPAQPQRVSLEFLYTPLITESPTEGRES